MSTNKWHVADCSNGIAHAQFVGKYDTFEQAEAECEKRSAASGGYFVVLGNGPRPQREVKSQLVLNRNAEGVIA